MVLLSKQNKRTKSKQQVDDTIKPGTSRNNRIADIWGWGDSSVGKVLIVQARGTEFYPSTCKKQNKQKRRDPSRSLGLTG